MKNYFFIFLLVILFSFTVKSQPGCPSIDAGSDQTVTCMNPCASLSANVFATGATTSYTVSSIPYAPPFPYNSGTAIMIGQDDLWSNIITLPFNFCFFGTSYNQIIVGANGLISFNISDEGSFCPWQLSASCPSSSLVGNETGPFILGSYHDINPGVGGFIYLSVLGSYPCRTFVVNFYNIPMYSCTDLIATHQIVLYESTNTIEVYVENSPLCGTWNSGKQCIGIQNATGSLGYTPPGRNTGAWSATNEAWRFTPNGTANYAVSWLQGGSVIATGNSTTVCPTTTTTYVAQAVYTTCDASPPVTVTNSIIVTVDNTIAEAGTNQIICSGQSANLTAYGGVSFHWSNNSNNQSTNVSPTTTTIYAVTVTDANGCTSSDSVQVTVKDPPTAEAGSNISICYGDSITLNGSQGTGYAWLPITNISNPSIASPVAFPISTTTYNLTVTGSNGCSASDNITITVYPQISASAGSDQSICRFQENVNLVAQGGTTYAWSPATGLSNPNIYNPVASPNTSTTYTVTVSDDNGCYETDDIILTVNAVPSYTYTTDSVSCNSGTDGLIRLSPTGGTRPYTYVWSPPISYDSLAINISAATYHVTITDNYGCDTTANISIHEPTRLTLSTSDDASVCINESTIISATANGGTGTHIFTWDNGLPTGSSHTVSPTSTTTYTVSVTDANGCTIASESLIITVLPPISSDVTANPALICNGENSVLTAIANGGNGNYIYTWGPGVGVSNQSITVTPSATTTYRLTVTDDCGSPQSEDSVQVIINPSPIINFVVDKINGCQPLEVHFTDNSTPAISGWLWDFGDYPSGDNNNSTLQNPAHLYTSAGIYTVTLEATTINNCTSDSSFQNMIDVYYKPVANFDVNPASGSTLSPTIIFFDISTNAVQWDWNFGDNASTDNTSTLPNNQHTYSNAGTYIVTLMVTSINGCMDTISKEVIIRPDFAIFFPTAFSPNGDGDNERFRPEGDGIDLNNYEITIYDRWGELVFKSNDFYEYWDGKIMKSSQLAESAVYSWNVNLKNIYGKSYRYNGHVILIK